MSLAYGIAFTILSVGMFTYLLWDNRNDLLDNGWVGRWTLFLILAITSLIFSLVVLLLILATLALGDYYE